RRGCCGRRVALALEVDDLLPAAGDVVAEDQQQVERAGHGERGGYRLLLVRDDGHLVGADAVPGQQGGELGRHLVGAAAAQVVVAAQDVVVEHAGGDARDLGEVLVAAVGRRGPHAEGGGRGVGGLRPPGHCPPPAPGCGRG